MIVPQLAFGGCTPIERNDSAASVSMAIAIMIGKKTITVVTTSAGSRSREAATRRSEPDRRLDELALAQRDHLTADRSRDIGDVDDADDEERSERLPDSSAIGPIDRPRVIRTTQRQIASR